jgi:imidazole glycerol-phosphate synthase subunit HisH
MSDTSAPLRITVFDYGAGNLHSLVKSLEAGGAMVRVETDAAAAVRDTDAFVLPGVGAFAPAAERLAAVVRPCATRCSRLAVLGICLGMQLLFDAQRRRAGRRASASCPAA